jgi:hypothetical protein
MISRSSVLLSWLVERAARRRADAWCQRHRDRDRRIELVLGSARLHGKQITKYGVDLYFRVINDAGGIHGRKVRTVYYDDAYRPQDAVANTKKLVEQDRVSRSSSRRARRRWSRRSTISRE